MKIAIISVDFAPNVGGVAAHVVELGKALVTLGHEVHVLTLPIADKQESLETWQGMIVHRPRLPKLKPFYTFCMKFWLKSFLKKHPVDIIHVHGMRPLEATKGLNIPVLFTNHTSGYLRRIEKGPKVHAELAQRLAHICHVLAPSEELCEATRIVGFTKPVDFIPNGVDVTRFTPASIRPERPVTILLARRLVDKNGVTVYAEAVSALKGLDVQLVFAGNGAERAKVESILKSNGMFEKSTFLGDVSNQDMPDVYRSADISVLPSFMEATSITGLESMACGLPLIGTRVGGIPTLITEGETGLLVPPGDPDALGEALVHLASNASLRKEMGLKARTKTEQQFSWLQIAERTATIYRQYI
ncbi:glycosyltransferase family 4 protein [Neptunomonas qingdaonensis]|uniref:Glycosyltransferase involved in cell wall bisynthesis n=1 Tax=Neptunomonas qingdaonensis TaxID=1045558 RepID=A0A1I2LZA0_9GAMM|nr:glycosyltransferase family 4 protein [Neptunomonas qingdaonensis]SFF84514.1 Glycosyltransferase involved in cell wall bisynthesis [Neptunomonas qingdaonensis]